ncbi:hypothetical protein GF325_17430, partial [Candidatus Bathyarchaeota archaeon]|nr:hypothetical protein [Candidatus Bathyarchaeota archaeon]
MNFFEEKGNREVEKGGIDLERFCVVFLAYFDEARGHQLLLVHPAHLKEDEEFMQAESKTIFIHSIWWMSVELQEELNHVDLEFNGRNYLAKKFHAPSNRAKKRSGMNAETPETIVLILSIPINLNPFGGKILNNIYQKLVSEFKNDFSTAIEKSICEAKIIKSPRDKEVCIEGSKIIEEMRTTIKQVLDQFGKKIQANINSEDEKQRALAYLLYQDIKKRPQSKAENNLFFEPARESNVLDLTEVLRSKVSLADAYINKEESKINLTLINASNDDLDACSVSIAYIEDFFEKYFYSVDIDYWFAGEELNFQFECVGKKLKEEYLITVK